MSKIIDIRNRMPGGRNKRNNNQIKYVVRHQSATTSGDAIAFANYHTKTLGWSTSGYHEVILRDGTVQLCYDSNVITNGVYGHNTTSYHICLVGNGSFTEAQERAYEERVRYNLNRFNLPISRAVGHYELSPSACPGIDMNIVRARLGSNNPLPTPKFKEYFGRDCSMFTCKGDKVKQLQLDLLKVGEKLPKYGADGHFGIECENAVKSFQSKHKLVTDGIVGPDTLNKLKEVINKMNQGPFSDVPKSHWASEAIEYVKEKNIMTGYSDGSFKPDRPLTRAEMASIIYKMNKK